MPIEKVIAQTSFVGITAVGEELTIELRLGAPYRVAEATIPTWRCPVEVSPIDSLSVDVYGADSVQAMCLAIKFGFSRLSSFRENGGRLMETDGGQVTLSSYSFPIFENDAET